MVIVRLLGGLGNQMFQYALYLSLLEKGFDAKIDITQLLSYKLHNGYELERIFTTVPRIATYEKVRKMSRNRKNDLVSRASRKLLFPKRTEHLEKESYTFDPHVFRVIGDVYFEGYWQNEEYFKNVRDRILDNFTFKLPLDSRNSKILNKIRKSKSVSIHIRRGDYLNDHKRNQICNLPYYLKAIDQIKSLVSHPKFFVFSDDVEWCRKNLVDPNMEFVDWNSGEQSYIDMQLMSQCKHNIIANSSFSWWGAWLNENEDKIIISPSSWYGNIDIDNIIPRPWIKI